ncbi:alpha-ribazole phosphatase [Flammeovirga sp. MY04]|uniref:alpha-ribazole phosphatase n=1 Tax=Flammeovirga sp. MY04 TaxID=1191459 RepID=UPI00080624DB|nr:alpha-ribazole phosphatase [Flammeovirga sp. MY04]ANQ52734.1 alpha-ribazole phosphatase [Flammeovirga sp. MY04]
MEVYIVRHTAVDVPKGICYGQTDVALKQEQEAAFERIKAQLPTTIDFLISSPLSRCTQLSTFLTDDFTTDPRLMECNFGDWEMMAWDDIPRDAMDTWGNDFVYQAPPNGESLHQVYQRVFDVHKELIKLPHATVVIIAHASVVRIFHHIYQNIPLKNIFDVKVDYGQVFHFTTIK